MIIVEGPDNSGKSTLINQLIKDLELKEVKRTFHGPTTDIENLYSRTLEVINAAIKTDQPNIIIDRFSLIGEDIYGPILRGKNLWDVIPQDKIKFWQAVNKLNPFIIYCRPSLDVILDMKNHQVKIYDTPEHVKRVQEKQKLIVSAYDNYFANWKSHNFYSYDYKDKNSYLELKFRLKEYLKW